MTYLLDASVLIPLLTTGHVFHDDAAAWTIGKKVAVCPIVELAFLRILVGRYNTEQVDARRSLNFFFEKEKPQFIADDLSPRRISEFPSAGKSTDWYLCELAAKHGLKLATLDNGIAHPAAIFIGAKKISSQK